MNEASDCEMGTGVVSGHDGVTVSVTNESLVTVSDGCKGRQMMFGGEVLSLAPSGEVLVSMPVERDCEGEGVGVVDICVDLVTLEVPGIILVEERGRVEWSEEEGASICDVCVC